MNKNFGQKLKIFLFICFLCYHIYQTFGLFYGPYCEMQSKYFLLQEFMAWNVTRRKSFILSQRWQNGMQLSQNLKFRNLSVVNRVPWDKLKILRYFKLNLELNLHLKQFERYRIFAVFFRFHNQGLVLFSSLPLHPFQMGQHLQFGGMRVSE